jgi:hypothetical protein
MKSLILMSYKQPVKGSTFRWGVLESNRDTEKNPLSWETEHGNYRKHDPEFERSKNLSVVKTRKGMQAFYRERTNWSFRIPFVGSLVSPLV